MPTRNLISYMAVLIMMAASLASQGQTTPIVRISVAQGLSNNYSRALAQDAYGNLWAATEEGLNRIDGHGVTPFYAMADKDNSLPSDALNAVLADEKYLWIATQREGLCRYDIMEGAFKGYTHDRADSTSIATNDITALAPGPEPGAMWVGTYHQGVELMDKKNGHFSHVSTKNHPQLPNNHVQCLLSTTDGKLYIGHYSGGLSVYDLSTDIVKVYSPNSGASVGDHVKALDLDPAGKIWIGSDHGLSVLDPMTNQITPIQIPGLPPVVSQVSAIRCVGTRVYVAFELWGLYIFDNHILGHDLSLISQGYLPSQIGGSTVNDILVDNYGNVWLATWGGGINFISHISPWFGRVGANGDLMSQFNSNQTVLSVACDDGLVRIGSDGNGVLTYQGDTCVNEQKSAPSDQGSNHIMAMLKDSQDKWWTGTYRGSIFVHDKNKALKKRIELNTDVRAFVEHDGQIWVPSSDGIYVFDMASAEQMHHYTNENWPVTDLSVRTLVFDSNGEIWVGTFGHGLFLVSMQGENKGHWARDNGFISNDVRHLLRDSQGSIWCATSSGLACFSPKQEMKVYDHRHGLLNTSTHALVEDSDGNIWFSTNRGIGRVQNGTDSVMFHTFAEGIAPTDFLDRSVAMDSDGTIFFGSSTGVFYFQPQHLSTDIPNPAPRFTTMTVIGDVDQGNTEIALYGKNNITLEPHQRSITIEYDNCDYALVGKMIYAYRLSGLDDNWRQITDDNPLTFRDLPYGKYKLELKSRLNNAAWGPSLTSLNINIKPPVYLSSWAKWLYAILILVILYFIIRAFKNRLKLQNSYELERQKLVFFTNITHELRTPLTLIVGPLEDMKHDNEMPDKYHDKLDLIHQSALKLLDLINEILEFRKIETQNRQLCVRYANLSKVVDQTGLKYQELNKNPNTKLQIKVEDGDWNLYFDREAVTSIIDNLLSNAIKYTPSGQITLSLYRVPNSSPAEIAISVNDTGYGIDPKQLPHIFERYYQCRGEHQAPGTGIGLALVKSLAELHQGHIEVKSVPGQGSTFTLFLLADNTYPDALHVDDSATATAQEEAIDIQEEGDNDQKPVLLIVEDNPDIIRYISLSFASHFEIVSANTGSQGLAKALALIPDIIVSDVMMPEMDGIEMCRALKGDMRTSHIPIILLTAKNSLSDKEEGYRAGADSYLTKPFSSSLLHSRINNLLEGRRNMAAQMAESVSLTSMQESPQEIDDKKKKASEAINKIDAEFLERLTKIIEENISSDNLNIDFIASELCMSPSSLYRKMKALTGINTTEYIRRVRMRHAEELLLQRKHSISEIAFMLGFTAPGYFRRCFKEEFGCTPSEFIKNSTED